MMKLKIYNLKMIPWIPASAGMTVLVWDKNRIPAEVYPASLLPQE